MDTRRGDRVNMNEQEYKLPHPIFSLKRHLLNISGTIALPILKEWGRPKQKVLVQYLKITPDEMIIRVQKVKGDDKG